MSRPRFLLSLCLILLPACPALCKECSVIHAGAPTPAGIALRQGNFEAAEKLYSAALEKTPADEAALSGLIRSQLYQQHTDAAFASAENAVKRLPTSALLTANLGEVYFRQGRLSDAENTLERARALDPCNPRVYLAQSRFLRAVSMPATARDRIKLAHRLSPDDGEITASWLGTQPEPVRLAALKKRLDETNLGDDDKAAIASQIQDMETISKARAERGPCKVVSSVASMKLPFKLIMKDPKRIQAFALDVRINDKATARLQIDTGASGILIRRGIASKAGLVPLFHTTIHGLGDEGPQTSYVAMADDLKIGQFELQNCIVRVSDKNSIVDEDGLIGGDVFKDYLLTIDFPDEFLAVDPLPPRPDEKHVASVDGQDAEDAVYHDAYIAPQMKDWTRILRFGHDLMVPVGLGDSKMYWFILDTGSFSTMLSPKAAGAITRVSHDRDRNVKGLSGKVKDVQSAEKIEVIFGGVGQELRDTIVVNLDKEAKSLGFDVSGFLGLGTLRFLTMQIDYRDGLVHFHYDPKHGTNRLYY